MTLLQWSSYDKCASWSGDNVVRGEKWSELGDRLKVQLNEFY